MYRISRDMAEKLTILKDRTMSSNRCCDYTVLKEDCTEDEFSWISEVLDDVARREGSSKFIYCYKDLMPKFQEECEKYNIHEIVALAERILEEEKANGKG